jgi:ribonuclease BN (tRNA processing enzyme)
MTTAWVGELARLAVPARLLLTHFSERYRADEWEAMINEVRALFPNVEAA